MIHRAILGSFERFIESTEHYAVKSPVWLPEQVRLLTVSEKSEGYATRVPTKEPRSSCMGQLLQ